MLLGASGASAGALLGVQNSSSRHRSGCTGGSGCCQSRCCQGAGSRRKTSTRDIIYSISTSQRLLGHIPGATINRGIPRGTAKAPLRLSSQEATSDNIERDFLKLSVHTLVCRNTLVEHFSRIFIHLKIEFYSDHAVFKDDFFCYSELLRILDLEPSVRSRKLR